MANKSGAVLSGDPELDNSLNQLSAQTQDYQSINNAIDEISYSFFVDTRLVEQLMLRGYEFGEIYYLFLLQDMTGLPVEACILQRDLGKDWPDFVIQYALQPSDLESKRLFLANGYKIYKKTLLAYSLQTDSPYQGIKVEVLNDDKASTDFIQPQKTKSEIVLAQKWNGIVIYPDEPEPKPELKEIKKRIPKKEVEIKEETTNTFWLDREF